jgi:hypothetical protein
VTKSGAGKRILFLIGEREFISVQERLFHIPSKLAKAGFLVDVVTYNKEIFEKAESFFKNSVNINKILLQSTPLVWSPQQRDDFVRIYIKHTYDLFIPGTDLKYWKTSAFDDFRGHIASHAFSGLESGYDLLIMPLPSFDEPPSTECDVFYSTFIFYAKERKIPVAGLQIYPVIHTPLIYKKFLDYFIVKEDFEKEYYHKSGIENNKIFVLDALEDNYCLSTIEDIYRNLVFDEQINIGKDEIGILIVNHPKYRPQIKEALEALSQLNIKKSVFFLQRGYDVRELSEEKIIEEIIKPSLERVGGRYYVVKEGALVKLLMLCDVIIATTYIIPLSFAAKYNKLAIVFNPLKYAITLEEGVSFLNDKKTLIKAIAAHFSEKQKYNSIVDIVKRMIG